MANSPTLSQRYVAQTVDPIKNRYPTAYIIHYMDDLLVAAITLMEVQRIAQDLVWALRQRGFKIAPEKYKHSIHFYF